MILADEYGNEFDLEEETKNIQQEQDINEEDRQVLNDRILGIINAFQSILQQGKNKNLISKNIKIMQDLAKKNLSIEKRYRLSDQKKVDQFQKTSIL